MRILIYLAIGGIGGILLHDSNILWGLAWAVTIAYFATGIPADLLNRRGWLPKFARNWWR